MIDKDSYHNLNRHGPISCQNSPSARLPGLVRYPELGTEFRDPSVDGVAQRNDCAKIRLQACSQGICVANAFREGLPTRVEEDQGGLAVTHSHPLGPTKTHSGMPFAHNSLDDPKRRHGCRASQF